MASGILRVNQATEDFRVPGRGGFHLSGSGGRGIEPTRSVVYAKQEEEQQPATLEKAQNVIQLAMERLEEEFCHLLAQNSRYVDPD